MFNMKKVIHIILNTFLFCLLVCPLPSFSIDIKEKPIVIAKGTFLKAFLQNEISTSLLDIGDNIYFINALDMYVDDCNAIPSGSKLIGVVEDLREPVQGTNAAIKIKIVKIITPNKRELPVNAYLYSENDNYLGGERTPALYYNRMPHYIQGLGGGVLQYAPTDIRYPGTQLYIKAGTEQNIILMDDLKIN